MIRYLALAAYAATIPAANWMIGNFGQCVPSGPCLIPVGFGLMAPSGVVMIGVALVLRDVVHSLLGWKWAASAIALGAATSFFISPPGLVAASVVAFLASEVVDLLIYARLRVRRLVSAVLASGVAGAAIDSAAFLLIAFSSLDHFPGQVVGKVWASMLAALVLAIVRKGLFHG